MKTIICFPESITWTQIIILLILIAVVPFFFWLLHKAHKNGKEIYGPALKDKYYSDKP